MDMFFQTYEGQLVINFAITGLGVLGFYVTFMSGQLSMAHQMFMAVGAYVAGLVSIHLVSSLWVTLPLSALVAGVMGCIVGLLTLRLSGMFLAIATLALAESMVVLLKNVDAVGGIYGLAGIESTVTGPVIVAVFLGAVVFTALLEASSVGLWFRSIADDQLAATAVGLRVYLARVLAFGIGGSMAGLSGGLHAQSYGYIEPAEFTISLGIVFVLAAKLGGGGSLLGPIVGAAVVVGIPELLRPIGIDRDLAFGAILIVLVIIRPAGLTGRRGSIRQGWEFLRTRRGVGPSSGGIRVSSSTKQGASRD